MSRSVIVTHGGRWNNNQYEGGIKDFIPIPPSGISYNILLSKIESRLMNNMVAHTFDIDAVVQAHQGGTFRMNVMDKFEWSCLMDMTTLPTLYVKASPKTTAEPRDNNDVGGYGVVTEDTSCESNIVQVQINNKWSIPGMDRQALIKIDDSTVIPPPTVRGQVGVGVVFRSKDIMLSAIHAYHFKNSLEFWTVRSNLSWYYLKCKFGATCMFVMRCKALGKAWKITKMVNHTCTKVSRNYVDTKVSSRAIAEYVAPSMTEDGFSLRPCDIRGQVLKDLGINLSYDMALSGRNLALKPLYEDQDKSFQMLPKYLFMLEQMNPGSMVDLKTRNDGSFQFCFFCQRASMRAFTACRPVLVIDATHLRVKYKGVLFVACSKDANEQVVPLAFGVGDKEESESWAWFLKHVRQSLGTPGDMLIVSDQHRGIKNAVDTVYPGTAHAFCTFYIQGNLKSFKGWKDDAVDIFHSAAKAYTVDDFDEHMRNLEAASPSAHSRLMAIGPARWASCKYPVRRYAYGTSNAVESLNSRLKWGRKLPITSLMEYARNLAQSWFYKRRNKAGDKAHELSEYAKKRLDLAEAKANSYRVSPISNMKFNICAGASSNFVDLCKMECHAG